MSEFSKALEETLNEGLVDTEGSTSATSATESDDKLDIELAPDVFKKLMEQAECNPHACGGAKCCTNILLLTEKEIARIRNFIGRHKIKPHNYSNIMTGEYVDKCPFLGEDLACQIYEVRPEVCRKMECNLYKQKKNEMPNYRKMRVVNMLRTFCPSALIPNEPDIEKMNKEFSERKRVAFRF